MQLRPGTLVSFRDREWILQPNPDDDILLLQPLNGTEEELTGVYLPLVDEKEIKPAYFPDITAENIGPVSNARLLFNAARLSFRNGAGPFRSMGRLSFRPRSYQMVPLIMALKQNPVRLLIADDVGVGKTVEALLIVKELLERREIERFAVLCLPHLCEQWHREIKEKFNIDAVIIRSNTQASLDREIHGDTSVFEYYPYQVISIDYIKGDARRQLFVHQAPECIIVDEAHTCARPAGATKSQQQRYSLLHDLSRKNENLILMTATPHSGKAEEFQSLLGLMKPKFESVPILQADQKTQKEMVQHMIQRRRADVVRWLKEDTHFPKRDSGEIAYDLHPRYQTFFHKVLVFAQKTIILDEEGKFSQRKMRYWTLLALLRGIMSSPATGVMMLRNRMARLYGEESYAQISATYIDTDEGFEDDNVPGSLVADRDWRDTDKRTLETFASELEKLADIKTDVKAKQALDILMAWMEEGYNPVVFCRYIPTAKYLHELIAEKLRRKFRNCIVEVVTSEEPDDLRKERILSMASGEHRCLIATDCISEGVNLQDLFTAVLHYDLPWNPNKLEQREGRVDRYGQQAEVVKGYLLYGNDNPIDGVVLNVLLRKVREIRSQTGITIPFPEESESILDAVLHSVLVHKDVDNQLTFDFSTVDGVPETEARITDEYEKAAQREKESRSIFAQHRIRPEEIENDLIETDAVLGTPEDAEEFTITSLKNLFGTDIRDLKEGYHIHGQNLPGQLKELLDDDHADITFRSPVPAGYKYMGRNHPFVENLCRQMIHGALYRDSGITIPRAAVIRTRDVDIKTTVTLLLARMLIESRKDNIRHLAQEMLVRGYRGDGSSGLELDQDEALELLFSVKPSSDLTMEAQKSFMESEQAIVKGFAAEGGLFDDIARERCGVLVEAHERYRKVLDGDSFRTVEPVLPLNVFGLYVFVPEVG